MYRFICIMVADDNHIHGFFESPRIGEYKAQMEKCAPDSMCPHPHHFFWAMDCVMLFAIPYTNRALE